MPVQPPAWRSRSRRVSGLGLVEGADLDEPFGDRQ